MSYADSADPAPTTRAAAHGRTADSSAVRPTPLTLVSDAVAGGDLRGVAETVARALGCPVAIAIPALGAPALMPPAAVDELAEARINAHAEAVIADRAGDPPPPISDAVPVRIAEEVVGIVAAVTVVTGAAAVLPDRASPTANERLAWLQAAASAASVTALLRESHGGAPTPQAGAAELLAELVTSDPHDLSALLARARRIGVELRGGAIACAARHPLPEADHDALAAEPLLPPELPILSASLVPGRLLALVPLTASDGGGVRASAVGDGLRAAGWTVALSSPRRDPGQLHQAVIEAELLVELCDGGGGELTQGQAETYRLLIGVLLRDRDALETLRAQTMASLADYDARHGTDLLETLRAFLQHDGSTTETAEAMQLHRHTVGYRLSRVHEVSGLSPYGSDGRERLSLGIKAQLILDAERRAQSPPDQ